MLKILFACVIFGYVMPTEKTFEESLIRNIRGAGYVVEVYKVQTDDNYILSIFRLPSKIPNPKTALLMHGLESSAADYVVGGNSHGSSLAYLLADNGFDVWLGNNRGNIFSQNHLTLDTSSHDFWDFSFHEIGVHDLPAIIDYALKMTSSTSLTYIGHSQGTTIFLVMLSMRPEFHSKISTAHLMAPVAYMQNPPFFARSSSLLMKQFVDGILMTRNYELFPLNAQTRRAMKYMCDKNSQSHSICKNYFMSIGGDSPRQFNDDVIPKIFEFTPASSGYKQFVHFAQIIKAKGHFLQFDHQRSKNLKIYNQTNPPPYKLSNIRAKIHFLYGVNDALANFKDVEHLLGKLKTSTIGITKLNDWNHFDFMYGNDVGKRVNFVIYNKMKSFA